jgi:hypothetical protein
MSLQSFAQSLQKGLTVAFVFRLIDEVSQFLKVKKNDGVLSPEELKEATDVVLTVAGKLLHDDITPEEAHQAADHIVWLLDFGRRKFNKVASPLRLFRMG